MMTLLRAAHAHAESLDVHAFIADAYAPEAQNAARGIVINQLGPFFFGTVNFFFDEAAGVGAVAEHHVLQFALATFVAYRAIERVIRQQKFQHVLARLTDLLGVGADDHAFGRDQRAGGLQLGHFFHFHQTHAACGLQ